MKILTFKTSATFRSWLENHHTVSTGIWLRIFKRDSGKKTITYAEALDQALCFGWIDGQKQAHDEHSWLQKFTPRRAQSSWSKINTGHAERLVKSGLMFPAGFKAIEVAKAKGQWQAAYDSPRNASPPDDFLKILRGNKEVLKFFETLNRVNIYAIVYRLQSARKPETRERRMKTILEMLARGEAFHRSSRRRHSTKSN
ncbi:MAG TPA: YdeI/OmpD-associated family protein [Candidatus Sulfotelmatobacter sp.]|jgi:uncharacterized protein YdeI (YjbR/CyaY-like superfamily)|nr:YdeI/OmpD-associated family protein [Candidatus Sulfotelmatobacter sp.]